MSAVAATQPHPGIVSILCGYTLEPSAYLLQADQGGQLFADHRIKVPHQELGKAYERQAELLGGAPRSTLQPNPVGFSHWVDGMQAIEACVPGGSRVATERGI